jgi:hypothetical protein
MPPPFLFCLDNLVAHIFYFVSATPAIKHLLFGIFNPGDYTSLK